MMTLKGLETLKMLEGFRKEAYKCSAGIWTIGYGSTKWFDGTPVQEGDIITEEMATELLVEYVRKDHETLVPFLEENNVGLRDVEIDALLIFAYNVGIEKLVEGKTGVSKALATGNLNDIISRMQLYNKITVNGKREVSQGLVNRRTQKSHYLFLRGLTRPSLLPYHVIMMRYG